MLVNGGGSVALLARSIRRERTPQPKLRQDSNLSDGQKLSEAIGPPQRAPQQLWRASAILCPSGDVIPSPAGSTATPRASLRQARGGHSAMRGSPLWTPWDDLSPPRHEALGNIPVRDNMSVRFRMSFDRGILRSP